jgi:hypothetical protein
MALCNITQAIPLNCISQAGGLQGTIWVGTDIEVGTLTTAGPTAANPGQVTAATGDSGDFYEFAVAKNVASFTENAVVSQENSTLYFEQILTFNLAGMDAQKRYGLFLLAQNRKITAGFTDLQGNNWLMGAYRGAVVTSNAATSGVAMADLNGYTLTLTAQETTPALSIAGDFDAVFTGIDFTAAV